MTDNHALFPLDLSGRHALVGGGSKGIGLATAKTLAALGATITLIARNPQELASAVANLPNNNNQQHQFLSLDLSDTSTLANTIGPWIAAHPVHILINNAGGPPAGPITEALPDAFLQAFHMHVLAAQTLAGLCLPGMKTLGYGRIINIISTSVKQPLDNLGVSNTTRAAMAGWAKTWANEVALYGITVNNVLPGATETDRLAAIITNMARKKNITESEAAHEMQREIPIGRFAQPHEIAAAVAFLASPAAAYITGHSLPVDGGRLRGL